MSGPKKHFSFTGEVQTIGRAGQKKPTPSSGGAAGTPVKSGWNDEPSISTHITYAIGVAFSVITLVWAFNRAMGLAGRVSDEGSPALALWLFVLTVAMYGLQARYPLVFVFALINHFRERSAAPVELQEWPFVTISVPAKNEAVGTESSLASLIALDYPRYEVIFVDDGSTDNTLALARKYEGDHGRCTVRVIHKLNGGKPSAHNTAFQESNASLVLCVDADTLLAPDSLKLLVMRMADPTVSAVAGQCRVRNRVNAITWLQSIEYIYPYGLVRMAQSLFGSVLIVPGPIGIFRRSAMEAVFLRWGAAGPQAPGQVPGPFQRDTFCEDFDLSLAILCLGGKVLYAPEAIAYTRVPDSSSTILNQRYRWVRGNVQVMRKYFRRAPNSPAGLSPHVALHVLIGILADLFVAPVIHFASVATLVAFVVFREDATPVLSWLAVSTLADFSIARFTVAVHRDTPLAMLAIPFLFPYQFFLLTLGWAFAVLDEVRGVGMRW